MLAFREIHGSMTAPIEANSLGSIAGSFSATENNRINARVKACSFLDSSRRVLRDNPVELTPIPHRWMVYLF